MRDRIPALSDGIHTLPSPAAMPPSVSATPVMIAATRWCVCRSRRHTLPSPQLGTQTLPKPTASPAQGDLPTGIVATMLLVLGSIFETLFLGLLEIQMLPPMATQSGDPGTG